MACRTRSEIEVKLIELLPNENLSNFYNLVFAQQAKAVVNVSVADQRADQSLQLVNYSEDKMENTQLLYMESVNILYQEGEWSYTEAIAQKIFANDTWQPYEPKTSSQK